MTQHWFRQWLKLVPKRRQAIICTNADPIHCRLYAALGGDELMAEMQSVLCVNLMCRYDIL